mmetsp:Transcript_6566/g.17601  ORF Transcript_6566/g.17601 Transcript_6566/m.17601 type:complete len:200 (-) Transcript_6566:3191-3790(-)
MTRVSMSVPCVSSMSTLSPMRRVTMGLPVSSPPRGGPSSSLRERCCSLACCLWACTASEILARMARTASPHAALFLIPATSSATSRGWRVAIKVTPCVDCAANKPPGAYSGRSAQSTFRSCSNCCALMSTSCGSSDSLRLLTSRPNRVTRSSSDSGTAPLSADSLPCMSSSWLACLGLRCRTSSTRRRWLVLTAWWNST